LGPLGLYECPQGSDSFVKRVLSCEGNGITSIYSTSNSLLHSSIAGVTSAPKGNSRFEKWAQYI